MKNVLPTGEQSSAVLNMPDKHTPGPWIIDKSYILGAVETHPVKNGRGFVAHVGAPAAGKNYSDRQLANLCLIAAAPELLDIARAVQRCINAHDCEHPDFVDSCADVCQMLDEMASEVKAAIAKAEARA